MSSSADEDEEWQGIDKSVEESELQSEKPTGLSSHAARHPSGEEVRQIREASELFKSGSFKLQVMSSVYCRLP